MARMNAASVDQRSSCSSCCKRSNSSTKEGVSTLENTARGMKQTRLTVAKSMRPKASNKGHMNHGWVGSKSARLPRDATRKQSRVGIGRQSSLKRLRAQHIAKTQRPKCAQWDWWLLTFRCCTCWIRCCNRNRTLPKSAARKYRSRICCSLSLRTWEEDHGYDDNEDDEEWDAGVATFRSMKELVELMITTSVPDASGADIDASVGKSITKEGDLYRTHLNLKGKSTYVTL